MRKISKFSLFFIFNFCRNFALGFATNEFAGSKILGDNKESIGICGDGLIYFNDDQNKK